MYNSAQDEQFLLRKLTAGGISGAEFCCVLLLDTDEEEMRRKIAEMKKKPKCLTTSGSLRDTALCGRAWICGKPWQKPTPACIRTRKIITGSIRR